MGLPDSFSTLNWKIYLAGLFGIMRASRGIVTCVEKMKKSSWELFASL
ncbi:hypothetical protein AmDm5_0901 [Acetobacter malorum]|nr:hypothetical protein AmDm5_0901 [Acetobacter malorum]